MINSTGATVDVDGTYSDTCTVSGSSSSKSTVVIAGTSITNENILYEDTTCTTAGMTFKWTYTSLANNGSTIVDSKTVTKMTYSTVSTEITTNSSTYTAFANLLSWCSKTDWVTDTTYDATGVDCTSLGMSNQVAGITIYDIFYLNGSSLQGSSAASTTDYPTSLNSTVYTKE